MTAAVTMAEHFGARALAAPSAGNAAGALAAYGAAAGMPVTVAMPDDTPATFVEECRHYGAEVHLVPGTIADAGEFLRSHGPKDAFDVSTLARAVSDRRKEDDGLRALRAARRRATRG